MLKKRNFVLFAVLLFCSLFLGSGCVRTVPLAEDPSKDLRNLFPVNERIHAKVGVFISDDLRRYVVQRGKLGISFQMEVGKYLVPITMQMAGAMFDEAVEVNSLPPYVGGYRPDVEAVIEPEILYAFGNAVGTFSGKIEARVKFRVKAYDLSGKVIWQGEALGESSSDQMDFVDTFLAHLDKVGRVGYQAGLFAAQKIIRDFNASRPPELYSLLEVKALAQPKSQKKSAMLEQADKLYQKGLYHFDKKNFQQALYGFQQAERLSPDDLVVKFYIGICRMYTGQRARALEELKQILARNPKGDKLAGDCRSWIKRLNDPLKISVVFLGSEDLFPANLRRTYIQTLTACGMYDIAEVRDVPGADLQMDSAALNKYLEDSSKKNSRVVVFVQGLRNDREIVDPGLRDGDLATEFELNADVKAYGTKKKKLAAGFNLTETAARMKKQTEPEKGAIHSALAQTSSSRLVLSLLGNEVF
jgi:tetratricopeptide (TPR) repeat protein